MKKLRNICLTLVVWLSYYSGIDALFYLLNRNAKRILVFHNILPDDICDNGFERDAVMKLSDFKRIIHWLRNFSFSVDCLDPKTLTITFDDGYRNQYSVAFKALQKRGIPMICFRTGGVSNVLAVDKLLLWVYKAPVSMIQGGDRSAFWNNIVYPKFEMDKDGLGENVVNELNEIYPFSKIWNELSSDYVKERYSTFSVDEQREMENSGSVIAWHTKSHFPLSALHGEHLRAELTPTGDEKQYCFSYPYGEDRNVSDEAIAMVEELGFPCAVSNEAFSLFDNRNQSRYFMPRISVDKISKVWLHYSLSGLRYFLVTHKLLNKIEI